VVFVVVGYVVVVIEYCCIGMDGGGWLGIFDDVVLVFECVFELVV